MEPINEKCVHPTSLGVPDAPRMMPHIYIPQSRTSACGGGTLSERLTAATWRLGVSSPCFLPSPYVLIISATFQFVNPFFFKKLKKVGEQGQVLRQTLQRGIQHSVLPLSIPYDRRYREPWCLLPKSTEREYITFPSVSTPFPYTVHQMLFSSRATDRRLSISHTLRTSFPFLWTIIVYQNFLKNAIGNSN